MNAGFSTVMSHSSAKDSTTSRFLQKMFKNLYSKKSKPRKGNCSTRHLSFQSKYHLHNERTVVIQLSIDYCLGY
jgi:hypothetical protein